MGRRSSRNVSLALLSPRFRSSILKSMTNEIVIGIDGSDESKVALGWGADEAMTRGVAAIAVNAWRFPTAGYFGGLTLPDPHESEGYAKRMVDDFVSAERVRRPGLVISGQTCEGHPVRNLIDLSADASLVVVGARGSGGFIHAVLGSVSSALLLHSHCPVAIVRSSDDSSSRASTGTIVVGVDDSDHAGEALDWAIGEARARGARLRIVGVWTYPLVYGGPEGAIPPMGFQDMSGEMETMLKALVAERSEAVGDLDVTTVVHEGACAPILLDEAERADLLVVGSRGRGGFKGLLLGSVSRHCAYHSPCPVIIVRKPENPE